jgi:hypothetical protein
VAVLNSGASPVKKQASLKTAVEIHHGKITSHDFKACVGASRETRPIFDVELPDADLLTFRAVTGTN